MNNTKNISTPKGAAEMKKSSAESASSTEELYNSASTSLPKSAPSASTTSNLLAKDATKEKAVPDASGNKGEKITKPKQPVKKLNFRHCCSIKV